MRKEELFGPFLGRRLTFLGNAAAFARRDVPITALHHALGLRLELLDHGIGRSVALLHLVNFLLFALLCRLILLWLLAHAVVHGEGRTYALALLLFKFLVVFAKRRSCHIRGLLYGLFLAVFALMSLHLIDVKCETHLRKVVGHCLVCVILVMRDMTLLQCDTTGPFRVLKSRDVSVCWRRRSTSSRGQNRLRRLISVSGAGRYVRLLFGNRCAQV